MPKQKTADPIQVTTIGLDTRSQEVLRMAFSTAGKGACILADNEASAEVGICNMDCSDARTLWQQNRERNPQRPMVVISVNDPALESGIYVPKPINIVKLIDAIQQAHAIDCIEQSQAIVTASAISNNTRQQKIPGNINQFHTGNNALKSIQEDIAIPDVKLDEIEKTTISYYSPHEFLQGKLHEAFNFAHEKHVATQFSIKTDGDWMRITADPVHNKVISEVSDRELEKLCTTPIFCIETKSNFLNKKETRYELYRNDKPHSESSIDQFLWKIALWTSSGRIQKGINPSSPIQLKHWPNLTRLKQSPNDIRIAALLSEQPGAPALVAKVLGIPLGQVFSFYAAAHALGLAAPATKDKKQTSPFNLPKKNKHHTLFGKILHKISGTN